jgi:hypothetical protein
MKQTQTIPETFLGVGYTRDRAGLPLEAVRFPVPQPAADQVLIRVAASSLNPPEYKLADLNFMGRTPPVVLGLDVAGVCVIRCLSLYVNALVQDNQTNPSRSEP